MNLHKLKEEQLKLSKKISLVDGFSDLNLVAGIDQAYFDDKIISLILVLDADDLSIVEKKYAISVPPINYIPGYLAYREGPVIGKAFSMLENKPDLIFIEGNGILHPRRLGLASHIGLLLDIPAIGVSKKLLIGDESEGFIRIKGKRVGFMFKTKKHAKPIFVSPGHKISIKTTYEMTKRFCIGSKLPEPIHLAHKLVNKVKRSLSEPEKRHDKEIIINE